MGFLGTQPPAGQPYPGLLPFSVKTYPVVQLAKAVGPQAPGAWPPPMDGRVAAWRSALGGPAEPVNMIYLHVPFCPFLCGYCPLYKVQAAADRQIPVKELFVRALIAEIELYGATPAVAAREYAGVYFGGGTPSELTVEQLGRILAALRRNFRLAEDAEITLEGVARQMAAEDYLEPLYADGVNRISFGVQSLDPVVRQRIGRGDQVEDYHALIARSRQIRPELPINVDMMSGLSEQSHESLVSDMEEVSGWDLNSVDVLFYLAMPGTRLHRQIKEGKRRAPDYGQVLLDMRRSTNATFHRRGFQPLTGEVFARADRDLFVRGSFGDGSPHRLNTVLALGPSAFGLLEGTAYQNIADLRAYIAQVEDRRFPVATAETLDVGKARRRARMLSVLRLHLPAVLVDDAPTTRLVERWQRLGLMAPEAGGHAVTELGRLWYNHMQLELLPHREKLALLRMVGDLKDIRGIFARPTSELNAYEIELRETLLTRGRSRSARRLMFRLYFGVHRLPWFEHRPVTFDGRLL